MEFAPIITHTKQVNRHTKIPDLPPPHTSHWRAYIFYPCTCFIFIIASPSSSSSLSSSSITGLMEAAVADWPMADAPEVRMISFEGEKRKKSALPSRLVIFQESSCLGGGEEVALAGKRRRVGRKRKNLKMILLQQFTVPWNWCRKKEKKIW